MRKASRKFTATLSVPGIANGTDTTFTLSSVVGLPTDTMVDLTIDRVDSSGVLTPAKEEVITGMVSGSNIINAIRGVEGTAQAHASGAVVEVRLTASQWNDTIDEIIRLRNAPQGFLLNGKIVPSVGSNNLTVALKTLAGTDPSTLNPVHIRIGDTVRTITSALSGTWNAGTNWLNMGSSELATKEVDLFAYLFWSQNDNGIRLLVSRIPFANVFSDFTSSNTAEKGYIIPSSPSWSATATDPGENIGRFSATLSAGAGYTWTVPTFTSTNLIQRPIFETRLLGWTPSNLSGHVPTSTTNTGAYRLIGKECYVEANWNGTASGTNFAGCVVNNLPLSHVFTYATTMAGGVMFQDGATFNDYTFIYAFTSAQTLQTGNLFVTTRKPTNIRLTVSYRIV